MEQVNIWDIFYICTAFNEDNWFRINNLEVINIEYDELETDNIISLLSATENKTMTATTSYNEKEFKKIIKRNLWITKKEAIEKYINWLESQFLAATINYNKNYIN